MTRVRFDMWQHYRRQFPDGTDVVIVTEDDEFDWGELRTHTQTEEIELRKAGRRTIFYPFGEVVFIANDGFPLRQMQSGISEAEILERGSEIASYLRWWQKGRPGLPHRYRYSIGDPFEVLDVEGQLVNARNVTPDCIDGRYDEALVMRADDGACGVLWSLGQIIELEVA